MPRPRSTALFSRALQRWVLACLLMATAAALASPLIRHGRLDLVCTGSGQMRLVQVDGTNTDGAGESAPNPAQKPDHPYALDCPNCLLLGPLPLPATWQARPGLGNGGPPEPPLLCPPRAFHAAPPPARGPPPPGFN